MSANAGQSKVLQLCFLTDCPLAKRHPRKPCGDEEWGWNHRWKYSRYRFLHFNVFHVSEEVIDEVNSVAYGQVYSLLGASQVPRADQAADRWSVTAVTATTQELWFPSLAAEDRWNALSHLKWYKTSACAEPYQAWQSLWMLENNSAY